MKIDKSNPAHWVALLLFGIHVLLALLLRPLVRSRSGRRQVVLYGHRLGGNLLALQRALRLRPESFAVVYLTLDRAHHRQLVRAGEASVLATSPRTALLLSRADAVISSHGLHAMQLLLRLSDIRFFDVWHGIPFKGFDADDFRVQHRYHEVWVASQLQRRLYVERFGFDPVKTVATGYPRTDRLVRRDEDTAALRRRLGVPAEASVILFAPTWTQDARGRSLYPFGHDEASFLGALSELAGRFGARVLMRAHLNSGTCDGHGFAHVTPVPAGEHPDTEGILLISDILICDWSSIAFDYLLLDRPTLFLDVPAPFRKGFSLGPEFRFGPVVASLDQLLDEVAGALEAPGAYRARFGARQREIRERVYGPLADGHACERCIERLAVALGSG